MSQPILDDAVGNYNFTPDTFDIHSEKVLSYNTLAEKALKYDTFKISFCGSVFRVVKVLEDK